MKVTKNDIRNALKTGRSSSGAAAVVLSVEDNEKFKDAYRVLNEIKRKPGNIRDEDMQIARAATRDYCYFSLKIRRTIGDL